MSDNIPFEIIKKVSDVKLLVRFRSVSKPWKSFIDSSQFIKSYGARHTHPHSYILSYCIRDETRHICLVDDDNETFKVQQQEFSPFVLSPLLKNHDSLVVGACHGLVCMLGFHKGYKESMLVIWNPSIGKSFGIVDPILHSSFNYGFGVCPVTKDPTVVKFIRMPGKPWHAEVFTLSSRVWNVIPSSNLPHESVRLINPDSQVVIDMSIYFGAREETINDDGEYTTNRMVVSFDLITKEFKVVELPDSLTNKLIYESISLSKLKESLVVNGYINVNGTECCDVWVMEHDSSFRKLFRVGAPVNYIVGFRNNSEPIFEVVKELGFCTHDGYRVSTVDVYDPCSQHIKSLGIEGLIGLFFMDSYKESLLLLNQPDSHIYYYNK